METKEGLIAQVALLQVAVMKERAENERLQASCVAMRGAMLWFVDRVEKGEVRSVRAYARFKEILDSATTGAALLRVVEAARALVKEGSMHTEVYQALRKTLADLDGDQHA